MGRPALRLLNFLTLLSLVLCVTIAGLWVRSYRYYVGIQWEAGELPSDGREIWQHSRSAGMNRGVLVAESTFRRWPREGGWFGPTPESHAVAWVEGELRPDIWLDDLRNPGDPNTRTLYVAGFHLAYPLKAACDGARQSPHGYLFLAYALIAPVWAVASLFAVLPLIGLARWWSKRRKPPAGVCRSCSYDLTGNVSGVCPECGTAVARGKG